MSDFGESMKNIILAGIGAVALTAEKGKELLDELVQKGELTVEQGKVLNEELKRNVQTRVQDAADALKTKESAQRIADRMDQMTPEEINILRERLASLDNAESPPAQDQPESTEE